MNERLKKKQIEKLRALVEPLNAAVQVAPADKDDDVVAGYIWNLAEELLGNLNAFFYEETQEDKEKYEQTINKLLEELADGKCPGVKGATAYKIQKYAAEKGYV